MKLILAISMLQTPMFIEGIVRICIHVWWYCM